MSIISANKIISSIDYFKTHGFELVDVPMCVEKCCSDLTKPEYAITFHHTSDAVYVASAEQSFIQMFKDGKLKNNHSYMALTPCLRDEVKFDDYHYFLFLKLELITIGSHCTSSILDLAKTNFENLSNTKVDIIKTTEEIDSYDLQIDDIEIGSYGGRYMLDGTPYTYGTGIAEPRFSVVLNKVQN